MRKFRLFALMTLLMVAALTLSGTVSAQNVTIRLWTGSSSPVENAALEAMVAAFEDANPTINVDLLFSPDYGTQLQTAFGTNDYPEVYAVGQFEFPGFRDSGVLMPAGDRIEEQDDIFPGLLAAFTYEDEVYCPPKDFSTLALLYNIDLFDAANLDYPNADWTWEDLYNAAEALTGDGVVGMSVAPDRNRWMAFFYANGGEIFNEDGEVVFNSDAAVESLEYYASFVANGVGNTPSNLDSGWNGEAFGRGVAAMTIEGNWAIGYLEEQYPDVNWGVSELPVAPSGGRGTLTFTVCWGVATPTSDGGPNQYVDESWALVNFLTGVEGARMVAESGFGVMPARASASELWLETRGEEFAAFVNGGAYAVAPVFPLGFGDFTDAVDQGMNAVIAGRTSARDMMDEAAEIAEEIAEELMD